MSAFRAGLALFGVGVAVFLLGGWVDAIVPMLLGGLGIFLGSVVAYGAVRRWRCANCGGDLGRGERPYRCDHCGSTLPNVSAPVITRK